MDTTTIDCKLPKYNNDFWTLEDKLGIARTGDHLAQLALDVPTPFTIGVIGKWGAGKTSILRRAFVTLGGQPLSQILSLGENKTEETAQANCNDWAYDSDKRPTPLEGWDEDLITLAKQSFCVWYSPWQHQYVDNPLISLLIEIIEQYKTQATKLEQKQPWHRDGKIAAVSRLNELLLKGPAYLFGFGAIVTGGEKITKAGKELWQHLQGSDLTELSQGQRFHIKFEDAIEALLSTLTDEKNETLNQDARLIIFIDDLDRCEDKVVVKLLESIKLYLNSRRCVFVFGMDDGAVLKALQHYWTDRSEDDNREYLEKLFQAHLPIPVPKRLQIQSFIEEQLKAHKFPDVTVMAEHISQLLEPNPRKIKNFLNSLCASWVLFEANNQPDDEGLFAQRFVLFHYLRLYHKSVWRLLERQPWALQVLTKVLTESRDEIRDLPEWVGNAEQRMLWEIFSRAFVHVLRQEADDEEKYRHLELDEAVRLSEQRIDRKRSDEYFISWYNEVISLDIKLPDNVLHLPIER
ncbi:MAG: P-loop NTPase fold protein [Pseudomonadota bacterium]